MQMKSFYWVKSVFSDGMVVSFVHILFLTVVLACLCGCDCNALVYYSNKWIFL